jgi:hypothetical protein
MAELALDNNHLLLRFMESDYPFGISKLFLLTTTAHKQQIVHVNKM